MSDMEGHPMFAILLGSSQFAGPSEQMEDDLKPMPEQYAIKPGDKCLAATANTLLEEDFTVMEILEPDSHTELFPDWEDRSGVSATAMGLGSHVLAHWFSVDFPEGDLGWFARVKLIPITDEQYAQVDGWRGGDWPPEVPVWIEEAFTRYTDAMSHLAPHTIPVLVTCEKCHGREVALHITGRKRFEARAGQVKKDDDKIVYVPLNTPEENLQWSAHLTCLNPDCRASATLEDEEWDLPR